MPDLEVKTCPLCKKPVSILGPSNDGWCFIAACTTMNCPYSVEYHGPGQIVPTTQYSKAVAKGVKGDK